MTRRAQPQECSRTRYIIARHVNLIFQSSITFELYNIEIIQLPKPAHTHTRTHSHTHTCQTTLDHIVSISNKNSQLRGRTTQNTRPHHRRTTLL